MTSEAEDRRAACRRGVVQAIAHWPATEQLKVLCELGQMPVDDVDAYAQRAATIVCGALERRLAALKVEADRLQRELATADQVLAAMRREPPTGRSN